MLTFFRLDRSIDIRLHRTCVPVKPSTQYTWRWQRKEAPSSIDINLQSTRKSARLTKAAFVSDQGRVTPVVVLLYYGSWKNKTSIRSSREELQQFVSKYFRKRTHVRSNLAQLIEYLPLHREWVQSVDCFRILKDQPVKELTFFF